MSRKILTKFGVLAVFCMPLVAQAGWSEFWERFHLDANRNGCWPDPFRGQDREALRAPFIIMKDNGWRFETTLPEALFHPETQALNRAGEIKVRRIIAYAPPNRRTIFVQRSERNDITDARVQSVQAFIDKIGVRGAMPAVMPTDVDPTNSSGDYFDQIDRKARDTVAEPRLPAAATGNGSGGQ